MLASIHNKYTNKYLVTGVYMLIFMMLSLLISPMVHSASWNETTDGGSDAGDLLYTAQVPIGMGALDSIIGSSTHADGDIYKIFIPDPSNFVASTVGGVDFFAALLLFDSTGKLWVGNSVDGDGSVGGSTTFFGGGASIPTAGDFFLAITTVHLIPVDTADVSVFSDPGIASYFPISPVTGEYVQLWQNTSWQFDHFCDCGPNPGGDYTIDLTGVEFSKLQPVPIPPSIWFLGSGLLGLIGVARRNKNST